MLPMLAALLCGGVVVAAPKVDEGLFTNDVVLEIQIEIPAREMAALRQYHWSPGADVSERATVPVTVKEGTTVYTNVALHLKGSAGSFRSVDDKPGLTLHFNKLVKGQTFHGLEKISLNNSVQDPTFITDKLCRELFMQAGVPVPRACHSNVSLNGRALGLYVLTEGWNKQFLKRHFKNTKGNFYDGGFVKDISPALVASSGEHPEDHSDLKALMAAARERNLTNRLARLEKVLDLNRFITMLALDALLWNWDGYSLNHNNYRVFHDLESDRFVFFPHGMDQMFWKPEGPIMPGMKGLVAEAVIEIPECQRRYLERVTELMGGTCRVEALTNRVRQLALKLREADHEPTSWGSAFSRLFQPRPVSTLLQRITQRRKSLDEQLRGIKTTLTLEPGASAPLSGWKGKATLGRVDFDEPPGKSASLHLVAREDRSSGAWRTTLWLEGGRYQVTGRVRVKGVKSDGQLARSGAGFRVFSRRKQTTGINWDWFPFRESNDLERRGELTTAVAKNPNQRLSGDRGWTEISYDFDLRQPVADLEISCELRGDEGEAWFDESSLKITRR